jgi:hypothetical protein
MTEDRMTLEPRDLARVVGGDNSATRRPPVPGDTQAPPRGLRFLAKVAAHQRQLFLGIPLPEWMQQ